MDYEIKPCSLSSFLKYVDNHVAAGPGWQRASALPLPKCDSGHAIPGDPVVGSRDVGCVAKYRLILDGHVCSEDDRIGHTNSHKSIVSTQQCIGFDRVADWILSCTARPCRAQLTPLQFGYTSIGVKSIHERRANVGKGSGSIGGQVECTKPTEEMPCSVGVRLFVDRWCGFIAAFEGILCVSQRSYVLSHRCPLALLVVQIFARSLCDAKGGLVTSRLAHAGATAAIAVSRRGRPTASLSP